DRTRRARSGEGHGALRERRARGHRTAASGFRLPQGPDPDREPREQEGGLTPPAGRSGQQSDRPAEARARPFAARVAGVPPDRFPAVVRRLAVDRLRRRVAEDLATLESGGSLASRLGSSPPRIEMIREPWSAD